MKEANIWIVSKSEKLPAFESHNFFHSLELFRILEETPGHTPYMAFATRPDGTIAAHMLAIVRRRGSFIPPYLFTQGRIYGEGEYEDDIDKEVVFGEMLEAITKEFKNKFCLYIELSDVSKKMFGYRFFRQNKYFPVPWQEVKNSLHSMDPAERISEEMAAQINKISEREDVDTHEVKSAEELHQFYTLLHNHCRFKFRRFIPPEKFISELDASPSGKVFVMKYKGKIIGGCLCVYSGGNAYLWYQASLRKRYPSVRPRMFTIWHAIKNAYENNYAHFNFLDVGLPFSKNLYREFILSFGGKPVAKYRWFRFSISWLNDLLRWVYRE